MQAFFNGHQYLLNITGRNVSTLFTPHCGSDRKLTRTLDSLFSRGDNAALIDVFGKKHLVPIVKFMLAIGDAQSSKTMLLERYLWQHNIPIISPGSVSHWLDNTVQYMTIARMSASNTKLVPLTLNVLHKLKLEKSLFLYSNSAYGRSALQIISDNAKFHHICIQSVIKVDNTAESVNEAADFLATTELLPRAILAFVDEEVKKPLLSKLHMKANIYWRREGRIFLMVHGLPAYDDEYDSDLRETYKGSLSIDEQLDFVWTESVTDDAHTRYLNTFDLSTAQINPYYALYWQQKRNCYLSETEHVDSSLHTQCDLMCLLEPQPTEDCPQSTPVTNIDNHYITAKYIDLTWMAFTSVIHNTPSHQHAELFTNKSKLFDKLLHSQIPKHQHSSEQFRLFDSDSHQGRPNYTVTQWRRDMHSPLPIYECSDIDNIVTSNTPTFYVNDLVVADISSLCSDETPTSSAPVTDSIRDSSNENSGEIVLYVAVGILAVASIAMLFFIILTHCSCDSQSGSRWKGM